MLHGRAKERAAIEGLLEQTRAGRGGCVVLHGEPGIGKTALLEYAAAQAAGMRVLRTAGVEPETDLGFATLHRLLLPVLDRVEQLPEPQARGLGVVFGQADGPPPDRFLVALATLSLLSDVAGDQPVLCLVDDAHWADAPSLDTLAFVARRLDAEPVAVAFAARADEGRHLDTSGLLDLPLAGLDRDAARALLVAHGGERLSAADQDELLRTASGNPLAIRELPAAFRGAVPGEPLPLAAGLRWAFLERARRRGSAAQQLLLLTAADGTGRLDTIRRAAAVLGGPAPAAVADLADDLADLVVVDGARLTFRHPLMRAAIYHDGSPTQLRAVHRALAAALLDDEQERDRRAWHLGKAAAGPDEEVAGELERSAERATRRAGPAAAAAALQRSAELSDSAARRAGRLVAAATAWWQGGHASRAAELLEDAERAGPLTGANRWDAAALRALMELRAGTPSEALALLRPVIADALRGDQHRAIPLLMLLGEAGFQTNAGEVWTELAALLEPLPLAGDDVEDVLARLFRAACRARAGKPLGLASGDLAAADRFTDPVALLWAGGMAWGVGDQEQGRSLRRKAVRRARALGAAGTLAWALEYLVTDELTRGRFATAEAFAEEGLRFAEETSQPNTACRHRGSLAVLAALRGHDDRARVYADEVLSEADQRHLAGATVAAYRALGLLDLAAGRYPEALDHFEAVERGSATHPGIKLMSVPELVEAAVRANQPARAADALQGLAGWADATNAPELTALVARCQALLATDGSAESHFRRALDRHAQTERPMEQARTALLYGQWLRRERRRSDARPHLRAALETFRRLGAATWAELARGELRATGETARRRDPSALATLTPQELRIVAAVSEGATNREVAAQLLLSPRTVDYHLRKVFQKAGVSSRAELIRLTLAEAGDDRP